MAITPCLHLLPCITALLPFGDQLKGDTLTSCKLPRLNLMLRSLFKKVSIAEEVPRFHRG